MSRATPYVLAWPLVNIYNRRLMMGQVKEAVRAGPLVFVPLSRNVMFADYVDPAERAVACPNQDVVYGLASIALDLSPVIVQVPDLGDRFWVYQIVDLRSDSFVQLGNMYGTTPGFHLLVGPDWHGEHSDGGDRDGVGEIGAVGRRKRDNGSGRQTMRFFFRLPPCISVDLMCEDMPDVESR